MLSQKDSLQTFEYFVKKLSIEKPMETRFKQKFLKTFSSRRVSTAKKKIEKEIVPNFKMELVMCWGLWLVLFEKVY